MGLLIPKYGKVEVDGINLHQNSYWTKRDWYKNISHVPQDIYLADNNIAENIAFGSPLEKIDKKKLDNAIKASNLTDLCKNSNQAFKIKVGEENTIKWRPETKNWYCKSHL